MKDDLKKNRALFENLTERKQRVKIKLDIDRSVIIDSVNDAVFNIELALQKRLGKGSVKIRKSWHLGNDNINFKILVKVPNPMSANNFKMLIDQPIIAIKKYFLQ